MREWATKYHDQGLSVIGVHSPEFGFEQNVENVIAAAREMRVDYLIALDSNYAVWRAFANHFWPALYIADEQGVIRYHHFGEGEYQASERLRQAADRLASPQALQLRLFQTMGEIATEHNSTIILPIPLDLFKPYLSSSSPDGSGSLAHKSQEELEREERETERRYKETLGDVSREVSSEEVPAEMPDGEANP